MSRESRLLDAAEAVIANWALVRITPGLLDNALLQRLDRYVRLLDVACERYEDPALSEAERDD